MGVITKNPKHPPYPVTRYTLDVSEFVKIGILVACHNRVNVTSKWLQSLVEQVPENWVVTLIAVDDGSSDGTNELLKSSPIVTQVERGDGSWYWAKSMSRAEYILTENYEFDYLAWVNDDTTYFNNSFTYVDQIREKNPQAILVGQFVDRDTEQISYGGMKKVGRHPFRYRMIETIEEAQECDVFNGNFVLIPRNAHRKIGSIDGKYAHGYADFDYSRRAAANQIKMLILKQPIGECSENLVDPTDFSTVKERIMFLRGRKGMPLKSHIRYLRKYGPIEWPIYIVLPYLRAIFNIKPNR